MASGAPGRAAPSRGAPAICAFTGGVAIWLVCLLAGGLISSAQAEEFNIAPGSFTVRALDAEGNPESRAGSHPDLAVNFGLEGEAPQEIQLEMPPGLGGDPSAVPACSDRAHAEGEECPADSQVGVFTLGPLGGSGLTLPIYRLEAGAGQIAAFGSEPGIELDSSMQLNPSDFGITFTIAPPPEVPLSEAHIEIWGVPAEHQALPALQPRPFLTAPSTCGPLTFTLRARSRQAQAPWRSATAETSPPQSGCESLPFAPGLGLRLGDAVADSPTGVQMELVQLEAGGESALAGAQMKDVTVQLPAGTTVSPAGVQGLAACSEAELGLGEAASASCPPSSAVGAVEIDSPDFEAPLSGTVYLGEELPGERFRLLVAVPGPGFTIKLVGILSADPATGALSMTLSDLPPAALSRLAMSLDGGPHGLIASPLVCGPASAAAQFLRYGGGPPVSSTATVTIAPRAPDMQCPGPLLFAPQLAVQQGSDRAGGASALSVTLERNDGEALPQRFSIVLPSGLSAALASVPLCSAAQVAASACPAASSVGTVSVGVGPGDAPAELLGEAYLTGPYGAAPYGLFFAIDARLGPFDLGTIGFRAGVEVDSRSGRVTVRSGPLPEAVAGMQVRPRSIELSLDRPGLLRNPTSCRAATVEGSAQAATGASAPLSGRFEVGGCGRLSFAPRLRLALTGAGGRRGARVALALQVRARAGETNLQAMRISLPRALSLDLAGLGAICSIPDANHGECPQGARIGTVQARSPLLAGPLTGAAYLVDPGDAGQPDVWLSLTDAGIALDVKGTTQMRRGRLVIGLSGLPDMPLSVLSLRLGQAGGGVLSLGRTLCAGGRPGRLASPLFIEGQDGAQRRLLLPIATRALCPAPRRGPRRARRRARHRAQRQDAFARADRTRLR